METTGPIGNLLVIMPAVWFAIFSLGILIDIGRYAAALNLLLDLQFSGNQRLSTSAAIGGIALKGILKKSATLLIAWLTWPLSIWVIFPWSFWVLWKAIKTTYIGIILLLPTSFATMMESITKR